MSVTMQAIPAEALASIADSGDSEMKVTFDNASDPTLTIITIEGLDRRNLLITLTGALSSAGLEIMSASINSEEGKVKDVFKVQTTADKKQLPESQFESLKEEIVKLTSSSSQSSRPAIYGIIAAAEVDRLRPLSGSASQSEVATLELAAAEMAQAAAELVATEREILRLREKGADAKIITLRENLRAETAAALERKMSAMEAVMAARRTILAEVEEKPKTVAERMMEQFMPPSAGARAVGGAGSGSGYEILFQGFNWESHKHNWYKTLAGQVKDLAKAGFTSVWLPPPSDSVSPQGYLPRDLYKLDTAYGNHPL